MLRFVIATGMMFAILSCKSAQSTLSEEVSTGAGTSCSEAQVISWIKEVSALEPQLITGQRYSQDIATAGNCTIKRTQCEGQCNSEFWGVMKLWYAKEFEYCMASCMDTYSRCVKSRSAAAAQGESEPIDVPGSLATRQQNLDRREALLQQIHLCTQSQGQQYTIGQKLQQLGHREQEWAALSAQWKSFRERDPLIYGTYRFINATFIDVPARRSTQSFADWKRQYESDVAQWRIGMQVGDVALTGLDYFTSTADYVFRAGIPDNKFQLSMEDLSHMAAPGMHITRIVNACVNAEDLCTAISCLGHRTQEVMSIRDNLQNVEALAKADDGREFAVCRHYAPTFKEVCNLWAKRTGNEGRIVCGNTASLSTMHAWPLVHFIKNGEKYEYIYDILNDPFAPDLIPVNQPARDRASLPCE